MFLPGLEAFRRSLLATARFVYRHGFELVGVSVAWFLLSAPLVTVGPATLGAYAAVVSLRRTGGVDLGAVGRTVRSNLVPAFVLGWLPGLFVVLAAANVAAFVRTGTTGSLAVALAALYALFYATTVLVGVALELVGGRDLWTAFKRGNRWILGNPVVCVATAGVTLVVLTVTLLLTVAFVLLFPALAFSLHVHVYEDTAPDGSQPLRAADQASRA